MNFKKMAITTATVAVMFGSAIPAFASHNDGNVAIIKDNTTSAYANTGGNGQGNSVTVKKSGVDEITVSGSNTMTTGNAKAKAKSLVAANIQVSCGCEEGEGNLAVVKRNDTLAEANTGDNGQGNSASIRRSGADDVTVSGNNTLTTGRAKAKAKTFTVVNTNVSFGNSITH